MTTYVGCPGCGVKYPLKQLYQHAHDRPSQDKVYAVVCSVCGQQFDVGFRRRWKGMLPLQPKIKSVAAIAAVATASRSYPSSPGR